MAPSAELLAFGHAISRIFGWTYFLSWSFSFYPQLLLNISRRTTFGTTPDFPTANIVGFTSLTLSNMFLFFSPHVRHEYAQRHPGNTEPTVQTNDVAFASHGMIICALLWSQYMIPGVWRFDRRKGVERSREAEVLDGSEEEKEPRRMRVSWPFRVLCIGGIGLMLGMTGWILLFGESNRWQWLDVVYSLGYLKLALTVTKYIPQVILNHRRRSTLGWSISAILLDIAGCVLSLAQLVLDSSMAAAESKEGSWTDGVFGNPIKLGLGNVSLVFDIIFVVQHYVLFGPRKVEGVMGEERFEREEDCSAPADADETRPLLEPARRRTSAHPPAVH